MLHDSGETVSSNAFRSEEACSIVREQHLHRPLSPARAGNLRFGCPNKDETL